MGDEACGPKKMKAADRAIVNTILASIYSGAENGFIDELLQAATWKSVYNRVQHCSRVTFTISCVLL